MIILSKPTLADIPLMQELVAPMVATGMILYRDSDEMANAIRSYTIAKEGEKIVGFVALNIYSIALGEVRSLIVDPLFQGQGIATQMIQALEEEAKKLKLSKLLVLTYRQELFERLGFIQLPKDQIPEHKIWADCIKCKHFPVCNEISLIKSL